MRVWTCAAIVLIGRYHLAPLVTPLNSQNPKQQS
eukprot:SAG31_NODE_31838_length_363_cov_0.981061_1_plen_33_part_01